MKVHHIFAHYISHFFKLSMRMFEVFDYPIAILNSVQLTERSVKSCQTEPIRNLFSVQTPSLLPPWGTTTPCIVPHNGTPSHYHSTTPVYANH